mmetsp:Transcript_6296/g.9155  ORF Transcript_6296/g.9155 Transcript_6296/m.9155 type:complete len:822 (-) Transcript_6296:9-2474(-)
MTLKKPNTTGQIKYEYGGLYSKNHVVMKPKSSNNSYFVVALHKTIHVYVIDESQKCLHVFYHESPIVSIIQKGDKEVISISEDGTLNQYHILTGKRQERGIKLPIEENTTGQKVVIAMSPLERVQDEFDMVDDPIEAESNSKTIYTLVSTNTPKMKEKYFYTLYRFEVTGKKVMTTMNKHIATALPITQMQISPQEKVIAFIASKHLQILYVNTNKTQLIQSKVEITSLIYNPCKQYFAIGDIEGRIKIYYKNGAVSSLHWHSERVTDLKFSADGHYLYSSGRKGMILIWSMAQHTKRFCYVGAPIASFSIAPWTQNDIVAVTEENRLVMVNRNYVASQKNMIAKQRRQKNMLASTGVVTEIGGVPPGASVLLRPNLNSDVLLTNGHRALQWMSPNGVEKQYTRVQYKAIHIDPHQKTTGVYTTPVEAKILNVAASSSYIAHFEQMGSNTNIKIWNTSEDGTYDIISVIDSPHEGDIINQFLWTKQHQLLSAGKDKTVRIFQQIGERFSCVAMLRHRRCEPLAMTVSPDDSLLVVAFEQYLTFWDLNNYSLLTSIPFDQSITSLSYLKDNRLFMSIGTQRLLLMNINTFQPTYDMNIRNFHPERIHHFRALSRTSLVIVASHELIYCDFSKKDVIELRRLRYNSKIKDVIDHPVDPNTLFFLTQESEIYSWQLEKTPEAISSPSKMEKEDINQLEDTMTDDPQSIVLSLEDADGDPSLVLKNQTVVSHDRHAPSWTDLFAVKSHALGSVSTIFNSYTSSFLLKKDSQLLTISDDAMQEDDHEESGQWGSKPSSTKEYSVKRTVSYDDPLPESVLSVLSSLQ